MIDRPNKDILKAVRAEQGLTQQEAAERAMISTRSWIKYESGERNMMPAPWVLFQLRSNLIKLEDI